MKIRRSTPKIQETIIKLESSKGFVRGQYSSNNYNDQVFTYNNMPIQKKNSNKAVDKTNNRKSISSKGSSIKLSPKLGGSTEQPSVAMTVKTYNSRRNLNWQGIEDLKKEPTKSLSDERSQPT